MPAETLSHHWEEHNHNSPSYSAEQSDSMPNYHRDSVHSNGYSTDGQPSGAEEAPTYLMEHLATFTVAKETGIVYPADGMRRLLQLEKSNGIWSQKMQLRLDRNWLLIMDYETGAVMERFPVKLIQEPTAFTSHDPMEMYNNILVFIVGDDRQDRMNSRSEMHIFQCQSISAQELVEDLKLLRVGKMPASRRARPIPPPPATPPPEPPGNGVNVREQVSVFNAVAHPIDGRGVPHPEGMFPRDGVSLNDETSSTSSDKYERDVTILNHCFDDIEKFIARLQHAAAASRELERRRRNRKSKKKDLGDGMLTMRAKPPPEAEFIDIFQKFKLSFNLLAKLKAHIHDPNAPELVHFLFTPLALIVDASHDTHYGPNLPAKVVSPLLTREAVNLLVNCVTSKETELWNSLGDAWLIPRDQWKSYVPEYHPVFLDGWSPDYPVSDEREHPPPAVGPGPAELKRSQHREQPQHPEVDQHYPLREPDREESHYSSDYFDYEHQETSPTEPHRGYAFDNRNYGARPDPRYREERGRSQSPGGSEAEFPEGPSPAGGVRDVSARSDISADSIERNGGGEGQQRFDRAQTRWMEELRERGVKIVQVTYPRTANNDKELTVIRGEYLEVVDDSRKWWKARNIRGQVAHVPHTIVTLYQDGDARGPGMETARPARSPPIPPPAPADWVRKERLGKKDDRSDSDLSSDDDGLPVARKKEDIYLPPPPPLPPLDIPSEPNSPRLKRDNTLSRANSSQDLMHEELKSVLTMFREKRPTLGIVKTPEVYITQTSNPNEVQQWLAAKGFSDKICKQLKGMSGNELFGMSKKQLIQYFGQTEGQRLDSQITIQRSISGYNTVRSSELRLILAKAREKVEEKTYKPEAEKAPPVHQPSTTWIGPTQYSEDSDEKHVEGDGGLADLIKKTTLKRTNIPLRPSK